MATMTTTIKMITLKAPIVTVITLNNNHRVKKILIVQITTIIGKITTTTTIMIMSMIQMMINKFIHMKMMIPILIKEEGDPRDLKIKKLSSKKLSKVIK